MTNIHRDELYDLLYDAQADLFNAIERLEKYVRLTDGYQAEAYIVDHLKIIASRNHGFLSNDLNLDDLIESLEDEDDEDDPDADIDEDAEPTVHTSDGRDLAWSDTHRAYLADDDGDDD